MRVTIHPARVDGSLDANASKSHAQRAVAIAALTGGTSSLFLENMSDDVSAALGIAGAMGAKISKEGSVLQIRGGNSLVSGCWDCGESGLALRMFAAIAGLYREEIVFHGRGSLNSRPVSFIIEGLRSLGVTVEANQGKLPLRVTGPFTKTRAKIDGSVSSQFLTGLLLALPLAAHDTWLEITDLVSRPYIELTMEVMRGFGVHLEWNGNNIHITGNRAYTPASYRVPGDWSGMSIFAVIGAIAGDVTIHGLQRPSAQPDSQVIDVLKLAGAKLNFTSDLLSVRRSDLKPFEFDATQSPDLVPALVALASYCNGRSIIGGTHRLRYKESDRVSTLVSEYGKLGIHITDNGEEMQIEGGVVRGGEVSAHNDHRIAMSLAAAGLGARDPVVIAGAECVSKSYPGFFDDMRMLGASVEIGQLPPSL